MDNTEFEEFILKHGGKSVDRVCCECTESLRKFLRQRGFKFVETEDLIHDVMLRVIYRYREGNLVITCNFSTYLYKCCKIRILEIWRWQKKVQEAEKDYMLHTGHEEQSDILMEFEERIIRRKRLQSLLRQLGSRREELIQLLSKGASTKDIQIKMGFRDSQSIADYKKNCKKMIRCHTNNFQDAQGLSDEILGLY